MENNDVQEFYLRSSLEHRIRNWLVIQRYRLIFRYRLPRKLVVVMLLGIERTLSFFRVLD